MRGEQGGDQFTFPEKSWFSEQNFKDILSRVVDTSGRFFTL